MADVAHTELPRHLGLVNIGVTLAGIPVYLVWRRLRG